MQVRYRWLLTNFGGVASDMTTMTDVKDVLFAVAPRGDPKWWLLWTRYMFRLDHGKHLD
jgi:glycine cleavage system aminomethyltransferase T